MPETLIVPPSKKRIKQGLRRKAEWWNGGSRKRARP
jgi:hypothetical protein